VKQTCRQDEGKYLKPFQHCVYLVRKSRKTCKRKLLDFAALVVNLQKTVLKIELYVKIGLNAFETCDGMRTVAKIAAYFMTSLSAV